MDFTEFKSKVQSIASEDNKGWVGLYVEAAGDTFAEEELDGMYSTLEIIKVDFELFCSSVEKDYPNAL
jgi:hypothetical protein